MPVYNWLIILCWAVFMLYWFFSSFFVKRNRGSWMRGVFPRAILVLALIFAVQFFVRTSHIPLKAALHPVAGGLGTAFAVFGIALAIWARYHLGRNWAMPRTVKESPELVTSGPYAYIRHPIYAGVFLAMLGSALATSPWWAAAFFFYFAYFLWSARVEERNLAAEFPEAYPEYQRRTKMLIPFIF